MFLSTAGHYALVGYVNCFVHAVMYFYYFLINIFKGNHRILAWKKHVTQLQLVSNFYVVL